MVCLDYQAVYCEKQPKIKSVTLLVGACIVLILSLTFKVWIKIESTEVGYDLARSTKRMIELDMERRDLALQRSVLMRHDNLSERAETVLGLRPLDPKQARKIVME